jgi:acyl-CoA synthetase (AMP-forming)/AMP-acid ligase II
LNLTEILVRALEHYGDNRAVVCGCNSFTYKEFTCSVGQLASLLREEGIGSGAPVAMLHRNCHHYLEAYFAAAALDAMFVPLNHRLTDGDIAAILQDSETRCVIAEELFVGRVRRAVEMMPEASRPGVLAYDTSPTSLPARLASRPPGPLPASSASEDDPAQLYYTSGTTGKPKGVILTHGNVASHAEAAIAELGLNEQDVWLHAAPLFHLADAWATWAITKVGGCHVMLPEFSPEKAFDLIAAEGVTITNLIPTMLVNLVHFPGADPGKLQSMRRILSGGAPMALELLKKVEALFPCEYVQTYGLTETSPYLTLSLLEPQLRKLPPEEQQRYRASTGRPMRGVEVKVVDEQGRTVPRDGRTVGEIVARGPTVTPGYFKQAAETRRAFRDDWLRTGDLAHVDPEGYLTIVDRSKDVINTGGEQVYSTEVENAIFAHPAVQEVAALAVPDSQWGEAVHAVVVLKDGYECDETELREHCRQHLAAFKVPRSVEFRADLPKTGSGKVDKKALREPHWRGEEKRVK